MPTPSTTIPWPDQYRQLATEGELLLQVFNDVEIIRTFKRRAPLRYSAPTMLVTNKRILFVDRNNHPLAPTASFEREVVGHRAGRQPSNPFQQVESIPIYFDGRGRPTMQGTFAVTLDADWVLATSYNERLHQEFIENPSAYQKPGAAWWLTGCRDWTSVAGPAEFSEAPLASAAAVKVPLWHVTAIAQLAFAGPRQRIPVAQVVGDGFMILGDEAKVTVLIALINDVVRGQAKLFGDEYVTRQPAPRMTVGSTAYYYVSGVVFAAAIMIGVLWGFHTPLSLMLLLVIGGCTVALRLLRRWQPRVLASVARERGHGKRP